MNKYYDVIIVGAGVIGCSIAYQLTKRKKKVLVLDKGKIGGKASSAAAGMLGVHTEFDGDEDLLKAATKSRDMFPALLQELNEISGMDVEFIQNGMLKLAFTESDQRALRMLSAVSKDAEWIPEEEVSRLEPRLSIRNMGALYAGKDGNVSARKLTLSLSSSAVRLGAEIKEFSPVLGFLQDRGKCHGVRTQHETYHSSEVIVAGGAWSRAILSTAGVDISGYPVKGECFSVMLESPPIKRTIFTEGCYLVPKQGNHLLVGATEHPYTFDESVTLGGISRLMNKAIELLPDLAYGHWEKAWAGVRPKTERTHPLIGRVPGWEGLSVASGHYRNGILLSPLTGILMADLMDGNEITSLFRLGGKNERMFEK
ncbi:glycine oxidase ThiO [Rossellomorea sp. NS-SX7]|uniref:glycine oxidase ThiO n=1 Tax=Rossellomorea sp. NS-SX7 TaxID=3463856 RepID=UPI004058950F